MIDAMFTIENTPKYNILSLNPRIYELQLGCFRVQSICSYSTQNLCILILTKRMASDTEITFRLENPKQTHQFLINSPNY